MGRAQASMTAVEAAIGIFLILSVLFTFALGVPEPATEQAQLDRYADDALTVLATEQPRHAGVTRLAELVVSADAFDREQAALSRRLDDVLPANVMYRIETDYGAAGDRLPNGVSTGVATVTTTEGSVTLRVWYV